VKRTKHTLFEGSTIRLWSPDTTMSQTVDYPTEYRGNTVYDEKQVSELSPENKPDLSLVTDQYEVDQILDRIGVEQDHETIVLEDAYRCLWVNVENGEYTEVWGIHKSVPYMDLTALRLK